MRIGVKEAVAQYLVEESFDQLLRDDVLVDPRAFERVDVGDLDSLDQFHREHAPGGELAINFGNDDTGVVGEAAAHQRRIVGLVHEVEFHRDVLERLAHQDAIVEVALQKREPSQDHRHVAQIGADDSVDSRILDFDGASASVVENRAMDLRERGRREWNRIERRVHAFERAAKFALDLSADHRERARRDPVVQARQRRNPFVGEDVGASRDKLASLDEQTFEAKRGAVECLRSAEILAPVEFSLVAVADEAGP